MPSVILHTPYELRLLGQELRWRHIKKLRDVSEQQEKPLRFIGRTVVVIGDLETPQYVLDVLSMGPKHTVLDKFNELLFLAEIDKLLVCLRADPDTN